MNRKILAAGMIGLSLSMLVACGDKTNTQEPSNEADQSVIQQSEPQAQPMEVKQDIPTGQEETRTKTDTPDEAGPVEEASSGDEVEPAETEVNEKVNQQQTKPQGQQAQVNNQQTNPVEQQKPEQQTPPTENQQTQAPEQGDDAFNAMMEEIFEKNRQKTEERQKQLEEERQQSSGGGITIQDILDKDPDAWIDENGDIHATAGDNAEHIQVG